MSTTMREEVHAIWDYYDGVLTGVAEYKGEPHYFEREWSEADRDYLSTYRLKRLNPEVLSLVQEQWQIFRAWEAAYHRGTVGAGEHPAEPGANARYAELEAELRAFINRASFLPTRVAPKFIALAGQELRPKGALAECVVEWQDVA